MTEKDILQKANENTEARKEEIVEMVSSIGDVWIVDAIHR